MITLYGIMPDGKAHKMTANKAITEKVAPALQKAALMDKMLVWVVYNNTPQ